ncbi:addiction module protein [Pseudomonas aeruginosa]|nr:addiction module protein [Pseudomonas aeruginosa]
MARLDPALAEEIRRLPISRCLELIQALLHRAGPEVERQWLRVAEDRLADCRAGTADALPLAEVLKRLGRWRGPSPTSSVGRIAAASVNRDSSSSAQICDNSEYFSPRQWPELLPVLRDCGTLTAFEKPR